MNKLYIFGICGTNGGIEVLNFNLTKELFSKLDYQINIVTTFPKIYNENIYRKIKDLKIIKINSKKNILNYIKDLKKVISSIGKDDLVYLHISSYCNLFLFHFLRKFDVKKVIIHGHNSFTKNILKKILNMIFRKHYRKIGVKIAVSNLANKFVFNNKSDYVINNGINVEKFIFDENARKEMRKKLNLDEKQHILISVGRVTKEKNQLETVKIANKNRDYIFIFVGDTFDKNYYHKIQKQGANNCIFVGSQSNVAEYLSCADGFITTSKHESFPLATCEAIANGLPVYSYSSLINSLGFLHDICNFVELDKKTRRITSLYLNERRNIDLKLINEKIGKELFYKRINEIINYACKL